MDTLPDTYATETIPLEVAGLTVRLTLVTNQEELLEALLAKGEDHEDVRDERIPYWADLWHAALGLAAYLVRTRRDLTGHRVTEIGCGLGLPGIVAGLLGADVTLTDYLPEALTLARHNWRLNLERPLRTARLDWRSPTDLPPAQLLLASDVAYETRAFAALPAAFDRLTAPGGTIILTEPNRAMARPFLDALAGHERFHVQHSQTEVCWNDFRKTINILEMKKKAD